MPAAASAKKKIQIAVPADKRAGVFSNAVSVSVSDNEVVLDFGYLAPGGERVVEVVSRVNLTHSTAENFLAVLQETLLDRRAAGKKGVAKKN